MLTWPSGAFPKESGLSFAFRQKDLVLEESLFLVEGVIQIYRRTHVGNDAVDVHAGPVHMRRRCSHGLEHSQHSRVSSMVVDEYSQSRATAGPELWIPYPVLRSLSGACLPSRPCRGRRRLEAPPS